tara:strand:- start:1042 stop:1284 length:243 start_codon:yes stop_codon:yes gene_type:complete
VKVVEVVVVTSTPQFLEQQTQPNLVDLVVEVVLLLLEDMQVGMEIGKQEHQHQFQSRVIMDLLPSLLVVLVVVVLVVMDN